LISHLLEDGHFLLFVDIVKRFEYLVETDSSVIKVRITSHRQLGQEEIQRISSKIESQLSKRVDVQTEIDPSLLGGIKLRVGNTLIDSSVSSRLHKLRDALVQV
jgi:F-type H+-transporting ATPase subunit delta